MISFDCAWLAHECTHNMHAQLSGPHQADPARKICLAPSNAGADIASCCQQLLFHSYTQVLESVKWRPIRENNFKFSVEVAL